MASEATHEGPVREFQNPPASNSPSKPSHPRSNSPTPYMAHTTHETSAWLPSNVTPTTEQEQHAMLATSEIPWTDDYATEVLFTNASNYELCQQSLLSTGRTGGQPLGSYFDSVQPLNEQPFEGWNTDNSSLVQPRSMPEWDISPMGQTTSQYSPSAFHINSKRRDSGQQPENALLNASLLDIDLSVERDADAQEQGITFPFDLEGSSLQPGYLNALRSDQHSPTPMYSSEHGGDDMDDDDNEKPYAQLIYQALLTRPDHSMQLQDIYDWIQHSTDKVREKSGQGWRNSIRHNLSMNKV
jgi:hypothetical protein